MTHNLLCISGGSTKAIQLAIAAIEVRKKWKPTVIAGLSAGAIIALPLELGMYDSLINEAVDIEPHEMFKVRPTKNGKITLRGWLRALGGVVGIKNSYSFGIQDTRHFLTSYITASMFDEYKRRDDTADIIVMTVDMTEGKPKLYNAKSLEYLEFIEAVEKSCHIPIMTNAVGNEVDGGLWAHNPEWYILDKGIITPNEVISIYAREEEFKVKTDSKWANNVFQNIERTLYLYNVALSSCGQSSAKWFCKSNNIKHLQLFCPQVLDELYDFDKDQLNH